MHPIIAAYAVAVRELKRNNGPQHGLWSHHTQVHGMNPDPGDGLRNQCQHFCWYFLPWHRIYLHAFRGDLRSIIVESARTWWSETKANWALPYWDYDRADSAELPPRSATRCSTVPQNPLFEQARDLGINSPVQFRGEPARGSRGWSQNQRRGWLTNSPFSDPFVRPSRAPRRGPRTIRAHPMPSRGRWRSPRTATCMYSSVADSTDERLRQAAGNPIFWLHHGNLDRLWEVWRGSTGLGLDSPIQPVQRSDLGAWTPRGSGSSRPVAAC